MAIASGTRDDEAIRSGIERWLQTNLEGFGEAVVGAITRPTAGLSSDTCFVTVSTRAGARREFVVRLPPPGQGLFPEYDLGVQVEVQNAIADAGIPTASPSRFEPDTAFLDAPFMIMPRVEGRVVTTNPTYLQCGWLAEAPPADQATVMANFLATLASLHRLDPAVVTTRCEPLSETFARWSDYLDWAATGGPAPGYLLDARDWCAARVPAPSAPPSMLWGDVQLANCVFTDSFGVAALLDFELTGTGPVEMDLGWFFALHDMTVSREGGDISGFGNRASMLATYEAARGRAVEPLQWYEVFALMRSGAIMVRIARLLAAKGVDDSWLTRGNPTEAALLRLRSEE